MYKLFGSSDRIIPKGNTILAEQVGQTIVLHLSGLLLSSVSRHFKQNVCWQFSIFGTFKRREQIAHRTKFSKAESAGDLIEN